MRNANLARVIAGILTVFMVVTALPLTTLAKSTQKNSCPVDENTSIYTPAEEYRPSGYELQSRPRRRAPKTTPTNDVVERKEEKPILKAIPVAIPADQGGTSTRALEPADWELTSENQKGKNYWPLTQNNYLKGVSKVGEPLKSPTINYNGYFTRPDGRTVIRLTYRKYDAATTSLWHVLMLKVQDNLSDLIDFNNQGTGIYNDISKPEGTGWKHDHDKYKKVTQFGKEDFGTAGSNNVYSVNVADNSNRGTTRASNEIPINLILKEGKTMNDVYALGQTLVQMRLTTTNKDAIYTDRLIDAGDDKQAYNSYTFATTIGVKGGYDKGLIRYLEPNSPHYHPGNSTISYNMEQGYIEVRHHFNREARAAGSNPNGFPIGYRQVVDKSFYNMLAPKHSETVAYMYQMLSNGAKRDAFNEDGSVKNPQYVVPIKRSDLNTSNSDNRGFLQVVASDFNTEKQYENKIKSVKTSNEMRHIFSEIHPSTMNYGHGIIIRYYVDKDKLASTFAKSQSDLSHSAFYSTFIYDNSKEGTDKYEFDLTKDVNLEAGQKIKIDFDAVTRFYPRHMMMYVKGKDIDMELRSNFTNENNYINYYYTIQEGMPLKLSKGTKITLVTKVSGSNNRANISFGSENNLTLSANKTLDYSPLIPDWQDTLSAGTIAVTDFKPEIDEIFTDSDKIAGSTYYIGAQIKMTDKDNGFQHFEASRDKQKVRVGDKEYDGYRFENPNPSINGFQMPELKKDAPILFTNRDIEHMALESKPEVVEQVQARVYFHHNNATSKKNEDITEKIVPLNKEYTDNFTYNSEQKKHVFTENSNYIPNGFEGYKKEGQTVDNRRKVKVKKGLTDIEVLSDHNGRELKGDQLKKRQMPVTDGEKPEVTRDNKKFLGWSTKENTTVEEFLIAKELTDIKEWNDVETEAYKFTEYSPVDKHRRVHAVWGDLSVILHHPSGDKSKNFIIPITEDSSAVNVAVDHITVTIPEIFYSKAQSSSQANEEFAYRYDYDDVTRVMFQNKQTHFLGWQLADKNGNAVTDKVVNGKHLDSKFMKKKEMNLKDLQDNPKTLDKNEQETSYLPNTFKLKIEGTLENLNKEENIDLYPIYRDYAKIRLHKQYNKKNTQDQYVAFEDEDNAKKHPVKFGLLYRTYVTDWNDPTVAAAANYYTIREDDFGLTKDTLLPSFDPNTTPEQVDKVTKEVGEKEYKYHVSWMLPVYDMYGQRISYAAVEVKPGEENNYKNFSQKWENLSVNVYDRFPDGSGNAVAKGPRGPEDDGKGLPKTQTINFDRGNEVDTFTAATYRDTVTGATPQGHAKNKFQGYQIRVYNTLTNITPPELEPIHQGDTELVINYKNKTVDKIVLKIGEYTTTPSQDGKTQADTPKDSARTITLTKQDSSNDWNVVDSNGESLTASLDPQTNKLTIKGLKGDAGQEDLKAKQDPDQKVFGKNYITTSNLESDWADFKINPKTPAQAVVRFEQISRDQDYNARIEMQVPKKEAGPLNEPQRGNAEYQLLRLLEPGMTKLEEVNETIEENGKTYEKVGSPVEYTSGENLIFTIPKKYTGDEYEVINNPGTQGVREDKVVVSDVKDFVTRDEEKSKIKETDKLFIQSIETAKPSTISTESISLDLTGANVLASAQEDRWRLFVDLIADELNKKDVDATNIHEVFFVIPGKEPISVTTGETFVKEMSIMENTPGLNMDEVRIVVFDKYGNKTSLSPAFTQTKSIDVRAERPIGGIDATAVQAPVGSTVYVNVYNFDDELVAKGEKKITSTDFELVELYKIDGQGEKTSEKYFTELDHRLDYKAVVDDNTFSNILTFYVD